MKALTLWQPWASLVALGVKTIETRSWLTKYRGPLAIHAAASMPPYGKRYVKGMTVVKDAWGLWKVTGRDVYAPVPLGAVVATCTLVDVVPTDEIQWNGSGGHGWLAGGPAYERHPARAYVYEDQRPYGDFTAGRFAWLLADIVPPDPPVPAKGHQGLWTWER